jgi:signal transduction histidine kinase
LRERFEHIDLIFDTSETPAMAMSADNAQIVFGHLLDNSARHGATQVGISAHAEGGKLHVRVADNGAGVSPGNRDRIFDPFFTTRRVEGGTGMGLGIVRALLRAHGGDIALEDSATGATFLIALPIAHGAPA